MALSGSEGDDAAHRVVRGHANGHTIAWDNLDSKSPHPAAQLGEHLVSGITLHAVKPARVDRDNGPLHINQIVFAQ